MKGITRRYLYAIVNEFNDMPDLGDKSTAKFDYFTGKNARLARQEIADRELSLKPSEEWAGLEKKRDELNKRHATRDEKGGYVTEQRGPREFYKVTPEAEEARKKDMEALDEASKEIVARRQKVLDDFNKMMDEEMPDTELSVFHRIKQSEMPALGKRAAVWEPLIDP
jgi:seryl-tRNA synthetase